MSTTNIPQNQDTEVSTPAEKLTLKVLAKRITELQAQQANMWDQVQERYAVLAADVEERINQLGHEVSAAIAQHKPDAETVTAALGVATEEMNMASGLGGSQVVSDLFIGLIEALRCAGINTAARMANELEEKYFPEGVDYVLDRFPWMSDYR